MSASIFHCLIIGSKKTSSPDNKIQESEDAYQAERRIAREIMDTVLRLGLPFKLDQLTEGLGNCFPIAITQQLRRPEIFNQLNSTNKMMLKLKTQSALLRLNVKRFITKSEHPNVVRFKAYFEETEAIINGKTWNSY